MVIAPNPGGLAASLEQASLCSDDEVRAELARRIRPTSAEAEPTFYGLVDGGILEVAHAERHGSERILGSVDGAIVDSLRVCRNALEVRASAHVSLLFWAAVSQDPSCKAPPPPPPPPGRPARARAQTAVEAACSILRIGPSIVHTDGGSARGAAALHG